MRWESLTVSYAGKLPNDVNLATLRLLLNICLLAHDQSDCYLIWLSCILLYDLYNENYFLKV